MALGKRQVCDLMIEVGDHLIEPFALETLASSLSPGTDVTVTLNAPTDPAYPLPATSYLYSGALIVIGWQADDAEVATVTAVLSDTEFTVASLANSHVTNEQVLGPTFPTQEPTDPVFTQSEILGYIAQAQNEFLAKVPLIFELTESVPVLLGQSYQTLPNTTIELERVAYQSNPFSTRFPIASISRASDTVTAVLSTTSAADSWTPQLSIQVYDVTDASYNSASNSLFSLATVSADGLTLTWPQSGSDSSSSSGYVSRPVLTRLYESAQEQIGLNQPQWDTNTQPQAWWEDRAGIYGWGVSPVPALNFYTELVTSVRGPETLGLLDGFMVPDCAIPYIKYRVMEYMFSKDGIERSPTMARYCKGRFDFGLMLFDRFLRNIVSKTSQAGAMMGGMF